SWAGSVGRADAGSATDDPGAGCGGNSGAGRRAGRAVGPDGGSVFARGVRERRWGVDAAREWTAGRAADGGGRYGAERMAAGRGDAVGLDGLVRRSVERWVVVQGSIPRPNDGVRTRQRCVRRGRVAGERAIERREVSVASGAAGCGAARADREVWRLG